MRLGLIIILSWVSVAACYAQKKQVIFNDTFNSLSKEWIKEEHSFESNLAYFSPLNLKSENGVSLYLNSAKGESKSYKGAEIRTKRFFKYGKFTARIKAPLGGGIVSGFFLYSSRKKQNNEIDFEFLGNDVKKLTLNHWISAESNGIVKPVDFNFSEGFHDYSIEWRKDFIAWSVDGKEIYRTTKAIPKVPLQVVFNIWISKYESWAGKINESVLPAQFNIAEITCYR